MARDAALPQSSPRLAEVGAARPYRYRAFLSYSHADEKLAGWLQNKIESFRVPPALAGRVTGEGLVPRRLGPLFRDRGELAASGELGAKIDEALADSHALIVLCSTAAVASRWTNAEVERFKQLHPDATVIAAIVSGEPFASDLPGREAEECFPPALRVQYDRRGRPTTRRAEPLAADLREHGDGRRIGFLKIVAGMIGVGLDDLLQREEARRQRRLGLITAASLAGMLVTTTLSVTAIEARDEARDQRRAAEGLLGFMLGELKDKLEPIGRLDALDSVGARALAYYQQQDKSRLDDDALAQRSRALTLMGQIATARGELPRADKLYREAYAGTAEALRRAPDDPQRLFDHAQNVFWLGYLAWQQGRDEEALGAFRDYKRLAVKLVGEPGIKPEWRLEPIYADTNLGSLLLEQRRFADAAATFQLSLPAAEALAASDPRNPTYRTQLGETLAYLGESLEKEGRLADALAQRERQTAMLDEALEKAPGDTTLQRQRMAAERAAGRLFAAQGDLKRGLDHLGIAVAIASQLERIEPANTEWTSVGAAARLERASLSLLAGDVTSAGEDTRAGCDAVARLVARSNSVVQWRTERRRQCLTMNLRLALHAGDSAGAGASATQLLSNALQDWRATHSVDARLAVASARLLAGETRWAAGDRQGAMAEWRAGVVATAGVAADAYDLSERAILLQRTGQRNEASAINARLVAMGYRNPQYLRRRAATGAAG